MTEFFVFCLNNSVLKVVRDSPIHSITKLVSSCSASCIYAMLHTDTHSNNMFAPTRTFAHDDILWTCTHGGCYATAGVGWGGVGMMTFFELAHMVDATQLLGWGGVGWGRDDDILWTCTHGGCYATAGVGWGGVGLMTVFGLAHMWMLRNCWGGVGWGGLGMMTFFELAHMVDATLLLGWGGWAKLFREACSNGTLTLSPRDAFDYQKHGWLTGDVENASKLEEAEERTA